MATPDPLIATPARARPAGRINSGDPIHPATDAAKAREVARDRRRRLLRRDLPLAAGLALVLLLLLVRELAGTPMIDANWVRERDGDIDLVSSGLAPLRSLVGARLSQVTSADGQALAATDELLLRSPRWTVDDAERKRLLDTQRQLSSMLQQGPLTLHFRGGASARVEAAPRGLVGLGMYFWLSAATALSLVLVAAAVLLTHPHGRNLPYAVIAFAQAANLLAIGIETMPGLGLPQKYIDHSLLARMAFDLSSAAAMVHLSTLLPLRLPAGHWISALCWLGCAALLAAAAWMPLPGVWAWTQTAMLGCGVLTVGLMSWSYRIEPNPFAVLMRRLAVVATATLLLLSLAVFMATRQGYINLGDAAFSSISWYLFLATLVLLLPVFSRAQPLMRELALLAGTSTVATSLDLFFVATFELAAFVSLSLSVFFALATYAAARQWMLQPMGGQQAPGAERMFEKLYRVLREVEARPRDSAELLSRLLRELFEPLQAQTVERRAERSRVLGNGSALLVPVPAIDAEQAPNNNASILLRFAARGRRMFSRDDAKLTDQVVDQLRRAVAYDKAVERGRSEERARIAQDLHDDIGARLLTLMYKSQTPELEDYLRHTLKDLKTLTRGLAASEQRLSHAAAEWKTDIAQRLAAAQIELTWALQFDRDVVLSVVQWSALTRILRELVSNVIQHSCATHVEVSASLEGGRLRLTLADDGIGREPHGWSHGLGLGGVRKRVKLLGGDVQWAENGRAGVVCTVLVPDIDARH